MSDANQTLGIDIKITKSGAGGAEAASDLRNVTSGTNDASRAQRKLNDDQEEGGKRVEKLEVNHRELLRIFSQLGPVGMEAGHAVLGALEGGIGIVAALAIGIRLIIDYFADLEKQAEDAKKPLEGFAEVQAVLKEAASSAAEFQNHLENIASTEERIATALRNQRDERNLMLKISGDIAKAEEIEAEARINAALAAHRITPEQAATQKAELEQRSRAEAQARANAAAQKDADEMGRQLGEAQAVRLPRAQSAYDELQKEVTALKAQLAAAPDRQKIAEESIKRLEGEIDAQKSIIDYNKKSPLLATDAAADTARKKLEELEAAMATAIKDRATEKNLQTSPSFASDLAKKQGDLNDAKSELDKLHKLISDLPEQSRHSTQQIGINNAGGEHILQSEAMAELMKLVTDNREMNLGKAGGKSFSLGNLFDVFQAMGDVNDFSKLTADQRFHLPKGQQELIQHQKQVLEHFSQWMSNDVGFYSELRHFITDMIKFRGDATRQLQELRSHADYQAAHNGFGS